MLFVAYDKQKENRTKCEQSNKSSPKRQRSVREAWCRNYIFEVTAPPGVLVTVM